MSSEVPAVLRIQWKRLEGTQRVIPDLVKGRCHCVDVVLVFVVVVAVGVVVAAAVGKGNR